jgi:hypothetical protein
MLEYVIIFGVLFVTHAAALYAGWRMGLSVQNPYLTIPEGKPESNEPAKDFYMEERLDVE